MPHTSEHLPVVLLQGGQKPCVKLLVETSTADGFPNARAAQALRDGIQSMSKAWNRNTWYGACFPSGTHRSKGKEVIHNPPYSSQCSESVPLNREVNQSKISTWSCTLSPWTSLEVHGPKIGYPGSPTYSVWAWRSCHGVFNIWRLRPVPRSAHQATDHLGLASGELEGTASHGTTCTGVCSVHTERFCKE